MAQSGVISVLIRDVEYVATRDQPLVFGRRDEGDAVGLDPNDMGISARAVAVEFAWGVWWIVNCSRRRRLLVEMAQGRPPTEVGCGDRLTIMSTRAVVLIPGAIYTHRLEICAPEEEISRLRLDPSPGTGTITFDDLTLSEKDRTVLAALFSGYLRTFPRRDPRPLTYQEAADLLGNPWTKTTLRKQVERVKERLARRGLLLEGARANDELAEHLISNDLLSPADLALLPASRR